jgi:hypothetical protein
LGWASAGYRERVLFLASDASSYNDRWGARDRRRHDGRRATLAKAEPSPAAQRKAAHKRTDPADGEPLPVHSFHTLLGDLATLTRNVVRLGRDRPTTILATPTPIQRRALDPLGVTLTA